MFIFECLKSIDSAPHSSTQSEDATTTCKTSNVFKNLGKALLVLSLAAGYCVGISMSANYIEQHHNEELLNSILIGVADVVATGAVGYVLYKVFGKSKENVKKINVEQLDKDDTMSKGLPTTLGVRVEGDQIIEDPEDKHLDSL